jgi:hypothetical protein
VFVEKTAEGKAMQRALLQYYEPRNAEKVVQALKLTHREDLIPLLVPAAGRRAVQRAEARKAPATEVEIHNDGTYTVKHGKAQKQGRGGPSEVRGAGAQRTPSPGARFAPRGTAPRKNTNATNKNSDARTTAPQNAKNTKNAGRKERTAWNSANTGPNSRRKK